MFYSSERKKYDYMYSSVFVCRKVPR